MKKQLPALLRSLREPYSNRIQRQTVKSVGPLIFSSLFLALIIFLNINVSSFAQTDKCADPNAIKNMGTSELSDCISTLSRAKDLSVAATAGVQKQVNGIKARVAQIENDIPVKQKQIADGEKKLVALLEVLNDAVRKYYIGSQGNCALCELILSSSIADFTKIRAYQQISIDQNKALITNAAILVRALQIQKADLEEEKVGLAAVKVKLDKVVADSLAYQSTLSSQIAQLSARQQQIIAQRLASLNIPLTAYAGIGKGCSSDIGKDATFSPKFGFFTYGVPNRVGLNQYGAKGRAEAGQNAQTILSAYYSADYTTGYNTGINIHVVGTNEYSQSFDTNWNIEEYLKHVYEVPASWPQEVLKAQAIAARSYALSYTNDGSKSICPSQSCQVVKQEENSDTWKQAVSDTAGIVLTSGGKPITAWFSSTHGGFVHSSGDIGWDSTPWTKNAQDTSSSISNFDDLKNNAYDKASPWFYCNWGSRSQYNNTAWMKPDEVADIVNTLLLFKAASQTGEHLYQTDKPNPAGTDTWDAGRVRSELTQRGISPYDSVSSISIGADFGSGKTTSVNVSGNAGSVSFDGGEFKSRFNLRAPANIQIVGPLYNVERN